MNKLIISPCGTSILTNGASNDDRKLLIKNANKKLEEINIKDKETIDKRVNLILEEMKNYTLENAKKKSAELNSLIKYYKNDLNRPQDHHILIKTDTYLGEQTSFIIQSYLKNQGIKSVEVLDIKDLQTQDLDAFQLALSEIVKDFNERLIGYKAQNYEIIFNLTGGFKSIQGFLQVLAMFYADKTIYIFESGNELLEIPKIPIKTDDVEVFKKNHITFRRLELDLKVDTTDIPTIFLLHIEDETTLSPWGEIAWKNAKNIIYEKELLPPPTEKIEYSEDFKKVANKLQKNRLVEINKRIDSLTKFLEDKINLKSLDFKEIKGGSRGKNTHEFDINSDEAKRGYCYFDDNILIINKYGDHLK